MKLKTKALIQLNKLLPAGSAKEIQKRLEKRGYTLSIQYIYRVLSPNEEDITNRVVIEEAVAYAEYLKNIEKSIERRIDEVDPDI